MTRYADPRRCPDCAHEIDIGAVACPSCDLPLRGVTAQRLFQTLTTADDLLLALRAGVAVPAGAALVGAGPASGGGLPGQHPGQQPGQHPGQPVPGLEPPRRHGLSAASVPKILLGLGAACLLIAALVFLAVTWSVMGVGGRTATLVGFTVVTGLLGAWMARRDLRGAAEALSLVSLGLLTMDTFGAREADWLGNITTPSFLVVLGTLLGSVGAAAALAARRSPAADLVGAQVVAGIGCALLGYGVATNDVFTRSVALIVAVVVAAGAAVLARRLTLPVTAALAGLAAAALWLAQLGSALDTPDTLSLGALWIDLDAWQLLVSTALVGAVALVTAVPRPGRIVAAATAYGVLVLTVVLPALDESATDQVLAALAALLVTGLVSWFAPPPWGLAGLLVLTVGGLTALAALAATGSLAANRLLEAAAANWTGTAAGSLAGSLPEGVPAPWLAPLCLVALFGTALVLAKVSPLADRVVSAVTDLRAGAALLIASGVATMASYPVPVWTVLGVLLLTAAGFLAWWLARRELLTLLGAALFLTAAVALGWYDEWLTVASLTGLLLMAGVVHLRARQVDTSAVAGALIAVAVAGSAWTWGALAEASAPWASVTGLGLLSAIVLTLHLYPDDWWACEEAESARAGVEVGAVVAALPLGLAGVLLADPFTTATWTAVHLTVAGAAITALSLLRPERRRLAWAGGALLALASWVRLWDIGVNEPEPYTLPSAAVLLTLGALRLRRTPEASTSGAFGPGLGLALVPSLLWVLAEPMELRALLLGLACLALVLVGVRVQWTAPVAFGAVVGAIEVARLAAPYIGDAVPRWGLIGTAGALLILVGVTWERRLQEARQVVGYVRSLR